MPSAVSIIVLFRFVNVTNETTNNNVILMKFNFIQSTTKLPDFQELKVIIFYETNRGEEFFKGVKFMYNGKKSHN